MSKDGIYRTNILVPVRISKQSLINYVCWLISRDSKVEIANLIGQMKNSIGYYSLTDFDYWYDYSASHKNEINEIEAKAKTIVELLYPEFDKCQTPKPS